MRRFIVLSLLCTIVQYTYAQQYILKGKITNNKLEPLAYVSVQIKELQLGDKTDEKGNYKFQLEEGEYELVYSLIGYETQKIKLYIGKGGLTQNILLEEKTKNINEVKILAKKKDKAEEYIKNVIDNKKNNNTLRTSYTCSMYIKATQENEIIKKNKAKKVNTKQMSDSAKLAYEKELARMSMTEISMQLSAAPTNKIKEERIGVKKRGETDGLFYLSTTEGNFSLYQNLIQVSALTQVAMLSPISYSGLVAYKYKTIKTEKRTGYNIYTIQFTPSKLGNALLDGTVTIIDSTWQIIDATYTFPKYHMVEYDGFEVHQSYEYVNNKAWMLDKMELNYMSKQGKSKKSGTTTVVYNNYTLDTIFSKNYFGVEKSITTAEAYERDSSFWNTARQEPLTEKELQYVRYKDSVYYATHTQHYLDSIDANTNKVTWKKLGFLGQEFFKRSNERTISLNPGYTIYRPFLPGGARIGYGFGYSLNPKNRKNFYLRLDASIGLVNNNIQGNFQFFRRYNPFHRGIYVVGAGRRFDVVNTNDAWVNLFKRNNYFQKDNIELGTGRELVNGLYVFIAGEVATRRPLTITKQNKLADSAFVSIGDSTNSFLKFDPYNVTYLTTRIEYTPFQMYMHEPNQKILLGSNFPTIYVLWRKGIPNVFKSVIDFDYLESGLSQKIKIGLAGISQYRISVGGFVNTKQLKYIDYQFIRRGDPILFSNPTRNFQLLDSTFAVFKEVYQAHYLHEFNGALINKIPFIKKLNILEVAGAGFLYAPERNLKYVESFVGIEKIIRIWQERFKIGFYYTASAANKNNNPYQFKIGLEQFDKRKNSW